MIDASLFQKSNLNYPRLQVKKSADLNDTFTIDLLWDGGSTTQSDPHQVKSNGMKPSEMKDNNLLTCCPTLLGFSLDDKFWGEISHLHQYSSYQINRLMQENLQ